MGMFASAASEVAPSLASVPASTEFMLPSGDVSTSGDESGTVPSGISVPLSVPVPASVPPQPAIHIDAAIPVAAIPLPMKRLALLRLVRILKLLILAR
jgi:hypothetical protein